MRGFFFKTEAWSKVKDCRGCNARLLIEAEDVYWEPIEGANSYVGFYYECPVYEARSAITIKELSADVEKKARRRGEK